MAKRICESLWQVGGPGMTDGSDCLVYALDLGDLVLVDCGEGPSWPRMRNEIQSAGLDPDGIHTLLLTHAHLDHMLASEEIKDETQAPLLVHKADRFLWDGFLRQCEKFGIKGARAPKADGWLKDGSELGCCGGTAIHTPGHTPGSMSFLFESAQLLVAGDTLFERGIGRTNLVGGSFKQIERSIRERLFTLDGGTRVIAGHGAETTIGYERVANPFFGESAGVRLDL